MRAVHGQPASSLTKKVGERLNLVD